MDDAASTSKPPSSSKHHHHHSHHRHHRSSKDTDRHRSSSRREDDSSSKLALRSHRSSDHRHHHHSSRHRDDESNRSKKRRQTDSEEDDDDDDDEDDIDALKSRKHKRLAVEEDSSDEGEWVIDDASIPPPPPQQQPPSTKRESWMMDGATEEESSGSGFDFGSFAGEAERSKREPKRTVFNRPAKKPTDPYFVRSAADELQVPEKSRSPSPAPSAERQPQPQSQPETAEDDNPIVTETTLNKMKAAYMKAKLRKAANAAQLEQEYNDALDSFNHRTGRGSSSNTGGNRVEVLSMMDTRGVLSAPSKPEDEMTIAEMVAEEKRSRGFAPGSSSSEGRKLADRIGRDKLFKDDLEYMDENAEKLARRISKNQIDLKNTAIDEVHKLNHILDTCPLCHKDSAPPIAPVVAMGTRVYLSLPTMPQLSPGAASIVPIAHRRSSLECDDDEWDEIRNFMKCLARMYHSQKRGVLFYENAANMSRRRHASIEAVPMPYELASTASAYFREAILSSDEEWSSHQKIINTLERATKGGLGKRAFRQSLVKEAPYFHVWFTLDGGYGHIIEDADRWPTGDLFAREVIGGMLDLEPDVIKRQSSWKREADPRMKGFRQMWDKFDWTKQLQDPEAETKF